MEILLSFNKSLLFSDQRSNECPREQSICTLFKMHLFLTLYVFTANITSYALCIFTSYKFSFLNFVAFCSKLSFEIWTFTRSVNSLGLNVFSTVRIPWRNFDLFYFMLCNLFSILIYCGRSIQRQNDNIKGSDKPVKCACRSQTFLWWPNWLFVENRNHDFHFGNIIRELFSLSCFKVSLFIYF